MWYQILCLAEQIQFTEDVENAIRQQNLHQLELELIAKLEHYTNTGTCTKSGGMAECVRASYTVSMIVYIYVRVHLILQYRFK